MSSLSKTIYTGVTNDLLRRVIEHKRKVKKTSFTSKYNITKLVYFEHFQYVNDAIMREKQIKGWLRSKKIELIESMNPDWEDLMDEWFPGWEEIEL
jgi:putative endonuclease